MERVSLTAVILGLALACPAPAADATGRESDWLAALRRSREALEWSDQVVRQVRVHIAVVDIGLPVGDVNGNADVVGVHRPAVLPHRRHHQPRRVGFA